MIHEIRLPFRNTTCPSNNLLESGVMEAMMPPATGDPNLESTVNALIMSFVALYTFSVSKSLFGSMNSTISLAGNDFWVVVSVVSPQSRIRHQI